MKSWLSLLLIDVYVMCNVSSVNECESSNKDDCCMCSTIQVQATAKYFHDDSPRWFPICTLLFVGWPCHHFPWINSIPSSPPRAFMIYLYHRCQELLWQSATKTRWFAVSLFPRKRSDGLVTTCSLLSGIELGDESECNHLPRNEADRRTLVKTLSIVFAPTAEDDCVIIAAHFIVTFAFHHQTQNCRLVVVWRWQNVCLLSTLLGGQSATITSDTSLPPIHSI